MDRCPQCKRQVEVRYRNKPKGRAAKFVCINCLPDDMRPPWATVRTALQINDAINSDMKEDE